MKRQLSLLAAISIVLACGNARLPSGSDSLPFDVRVWKSEASTLPDGGISERQEMLGDVVTNVLPGLDRGQIEDVLGASLETEYFRSVDKDMIYFLGPERNSYFNIDSEWLLIWLNEDGSFERFAIVND